MAKIIKNEKGFKVIEISSVELINSRNLGSIGVCDSCNKAPLNGYYVAVLNYWMCEDCYNEWYSDAINYKEDREIEQILFDKYKKILNLN